MKLKVIGLIVSLSLVTVMFAQNNVTPVSSGKVEFKPKTEAELKAGNSMKLKITPQNLADIKEAASPYLKMAGVESDGSNILVILDGKKVEYKVLQALNPSEIQSLTVLKDKKVTMDANMTKDNPALKEFASKQYQRAFLITTKKKEATKN